MTDKWNKSRQYKQSEQSRQSRQSEQSKQSRQSEQSRQWMINLSKRVNTINAPLPYVPLLLKDITAYVQLNDYESNRIKTIQTIGYIQREEDYIKIIDFNIKGVEFPICIKQLPITDIYFDVPRNNCNNIWEYNAVRLYGTLVKKEAQITIIVRHVLAVKDVFICEKMFESLALLARTGYHQYSITVKEDKLSELL